MAVFMAAKICSEELQSRVLLRTTFLEFQSEYSMSCFT